MKIIECVQGSPEWHAARVGRVTASRASDVVSRIKTGWGASRANYLAELIAERLTGAAAEGYTNAAMQWGTDKEPEARTVYEFLCDEPVVLVGFVEHPTIAAAGCSPDGLVGDGGMLEIKCPSTSTHIDTLLGEAVPSKYITQMQFQMACTGRKWCDFVSYDPRLPESMRLFVKRVHRDDAAIATLNAEVTTFLAELDSKIAALTKLYKREAA